jgi:hypothetical protein
MKREDPYVEGSPREMEAEDLLDAAPSWPFSAYEARRRDPATLLRPEPCPAPPSISRRQVSEGAPIGDDPRRRVVVARPWNRGGAPRDGEGEAGGRTDGRGAERSSRGAPEFLFLF